MLRVTIDGREVTVTPGSNLLAAVRKAGIDLPALCYHPGCEPNTACMVCLVRIVDEDRVVPACATPARDELAVECEAAPLQELRRGVLELILSDHVGEDGLCDCPADQLCRVRKYAATMGTDTHRFAGERSHASDIREHPDIVYAPDRCILCGICVQICEQFDESVGLALLGRGFDARVDTPLSEPLDEALHSAALRCAGACPTGALTRR